MIENNSTHYIRPIGEVYLPVNSRPLVVESNTIKFFDDSDVRQPNRIFTHLKRGGLALVSGAQGEIQQLAEYLQKRRNELVSYEKPAYDRKRDRRNRTSTRRERVKPTGIEPQKRLMVLADSEGKLQLDPSPELPFLIELIGELEGINGKFPFMLPWEQLTDIQSALSIQYMLEGFECSFLAGQSVLPPKSQETTDLFRRGLKTLSYPDQILDLGCGSGILTILARTEFPTAQVTAVDIMPEALATTKINLKNHRKLDLVSVYHSDLFQGISDKTFDVILFNAPWVVARSRRRSELPTNDEKQKILTRFFEQVGNHLKPNGDLLLGYADHSGPNAIKKLADLIDHFGFKNHEQYKARVSTHRSNKKWQTISVYHLRRRF